MVSIISPVFNVEKFIKETIESVLSQTYTDWELLFVDDCSKDKSVDIIRSYNDPRIKLFINEKNSGAAISRNFAIAHAQGKYIAFLDSDDIWTSDKLEKQIKFMENNDYHFSYTKYQEIDDESKPLNRMISGPKKITKRKMFNYCWPGCLTVMYDREYVGLIQIEDLKKNNDYAIWLKVIKHANCFLLEESLAFYRRRSNGSISSGKKTKLIKHHYFLFRYGEHMGRIRSIYHTIKNLFYGVKKKLFYNKKLK